MPEVPKDTEKKYDIACRPDEIEFVPTRAGAVIGTVARKIYLGTMIDYRIKIGNSEIRVPKNASQPRLQEGEHCALRFTCLHWYERGNADTWQV